MPQRQNKFLVMTAAHQNGLKFLEDMISVFLSNLIVFLLHRTSEATVTQIFSVMLSPFSQLCLNSFLGLEGNPVYPPSKKSRDISSSMCFGTTPFTSCIFHISWNIEPANDTFKVLTELSIKKCNNQSNAPHITHQHCITCTTIVIHLSSLLKIVPSW